MYVVFVTNDSSLWWLVHIGRFYLKDTFPDFKLVHCKKNCRCWSQGHRIIQSPLVLRDFLYNRAPSRVKIANCNKIINNFYSIPLRECVFQTYTSDAESSEVHITIHCDLIIKLNCGALYSHISKPPMCQTPNWCILSTNSCAWSQHLRTQAATMPTMELHPIWFASFIFVIIDFWFGQNTVPVGQRHRVNSMADTIH